MGSHEEDDFIRQAKQLIESVRKTHPGVAAKTPPVSQDPSKPPPLTPLEEPSVKTTPIITEPTPPGVSVVSPPPEDGKKPHPPREDAGLDPAKQFSVRAPQQQKSLSEGVVSGMWSADVGVSEEVSKSGGARPVAAAGVPGESGAGIVQEETGEPLEQPVS